MRWLDLAICYGASLCYLVIGIAFIPFWILSALSGDLDVTTKVMMGVAALLGLVALVSLCYKVCHPRSNRVCDSKIRLLSLMGMLSSVVILYQADAIEKLFEMHSLLLLVPMALSLHVLYLGRNYYLYCRHNKKADG